MESRSLEEILPLIPSPYTVAGESSGRSFSNVRPVLDADEESLVFIASGRADAQALAEATRAKIIICDSTVDAQAPALATKSLIVVADPRLAFATIANALVSRPPAWGVHPTASIHAEATVHEETYVGPFSYVGRAQIGRGSVIHGHVHIYDDVRIGADVTIHAGTVIGATGFGYVRGEDGTVTNFPHVGGVVIEDGVEIGSNTSIDRGSLGDTIIRRGARIDNLVHIAHNVVVGRDAFVIANAMVGGSTELGEASWVSPSATLRDGIAIGARATVGLGALVTKDVPDGETWAGSPARPLADFLAMQSKLKGL